MALKLYNSLSRSLEEFVPQNPNSVSLYMCGPTVYNYPHIGNYRAYIFGDILKRVLLYSDYTVDHVMCITDIDDKTIRDSMVTGQTLKEFTEFYTAAFFADRDTLNIIPAREYTKATNYVKEMLVMIETLLEKGVAYAEPDGSVYFNIKKFPSYGKLAHIDLAELKNNAAGRIKNDEYEKESAQDFALWKSWDSADGDVFWEPDTILGKSTMMKKGRPGWHIECSAMSIKTLGKTIDIHTGGIDNMFPHHENEIAQSESTTGKQFVRYWLHCAHLMVDGKKMSKSLGNFYTLRDLAAKGFSPAAYRYINLLTHYRSPLNFTFDSLTSATTTLQRIKTTLSLLRNESANPGVISDVYNTQFITAIENDLNLPEAVATLHELIADNSISTPDKLITIQEFDRVLGLELLTMYAVPDNISFLIKERDTARKEKNWQRSDELRSQIDALGYTVLDTENGSVVEKKAI